MDTPGHTEERRVSQARVVFGLVVMLAGTLLLLDRLDWWGVRLNVPLWPWVLVALGLARLSDRSTDANGCMRGRRSAAWLLLIGGWGLLNEYRIFGIHYGHSWPILLIGAGAMVVWRALDHPPRVTVPREPESEP
jgi:cell wall-active antibiotic response 4TMS protein YvqF